MKKLKQISVLLLFVCCGLMAGAQCLINANFGYTINPNHVHVFTDSSTSSGGYQISQHYWSFGDGGTSALTNPTHQYTTPGHFTVCEYVRGTNDNGVTYCLDTFCREVSNCDGMVQAAISANVQGAYVVFTGTGSSNYPPLHYSWTFPGGTPSTSSTNVTTVQYNSAGVHQACLTVTDSNGCSAYVCQNVQTTFSNCGSVNADFNYSSHNQNVVLTSTSTGTGSNTLYQWWMDGQAISNKTPNYDFYPNGVAIGTHTFCLYLYSDQNTFCDSTCKSGTVVSCVGASSFQTVVHGDTANIYPSNTGGNDNYWTFGDGTSRYDTTGHITHVYPANATTTTYTICHVRTTSNCSDTTCQAVVIPGTGSCGTASFTHSQVAGHLVLTSTSTGSGNTAVWAIRNANGVGVATGSGTPFTVTANLNGVYQVCLYLYSSNQTLCDSTCQTITVTNCTISAGFQFVVNGTSVTFYPATSGVSNHWQFGNLAGITDTSSHVTYVFPSSANAETYQVCHTVIRNSCEDTVCQYVTIPGTSTCGTASFTSSQSSGHLVLTSTSTGSGNSVVWAIRNLNGVGVLTGSGSPFTASTLPNGTYRVCLYLYNSNQTLCDSTCETIAVTNANPCNGFSAQWTQTYNSNGSVSFVSTNQLSGANYYWTFGDGASATTADPVHGYSAGGLYTVCLAVYVPGTICSDTVCHSIQANPVTTCNATAAVVAHGNGNGSSTLEVAVTGLTPATYSWSNGATTASITITASGNYCVTVTNGNNCYATACYSYTASCGHASFTSSVVNGSIHANSTSTGVNANSHYYWNVWGANNNLIQTQSGVSTVFESQVLPAGTYRVCLFLYGSNTQTLCDSTCETVTIVNANPCAGLNADFTYTYLSSGGVQFYPVANSSTTTSYWNFGDGTTSTNNDPIHYFTTAGLYTICHVVEVPGSNCFDSTCLAIQVTAGNPCNGFSVHINSGNNPNVPAALEAVVNGGTPAYSYSWNTGETTAAIHPTTGGVYCVTVYESHQCSAAACDTFITTTPACNAAYTYTHVNCSTIQFANTSTGGFSNQVWYFGDGTTSSAANPVHSFPVGTWTVQLTVYNSGTNCQSSYYQVITVQPCGINDTICGVVFVDLNGNGVQDGGEQGFGGGTIYAGNYHETVGANGHYYLIIPAGTYTLYYCAPSGYAFSIPVGTQNPNSNTTTCASYQITTSGGSHCGYNFGLQNSNTTICGTVYFDANNNHVHDAGETGVANAVVTITSNNNTVFHAYTDQNGHYCANVPAGVYVISVTTTIGGVVTPQVISIATVAGTNYYDNDFGVYVQPGSCNLSIDIIPHTTVTPGYPAWYDLEICNVGASVSTGTASLFFDPALVFTSSSPAQATANNSTHTVTWAITNLAPGACQHYWVDFDALTTVQPGQAVFMLANVVTTNCNEADFSNNVDTVHQEATASWDPNNKIVLPAGIGSEGLIMGDELLTYTVNFQNTGTAPAVNIVVRDLLDDDLDIETFRMLGASHNYTMQFAGREAIWKFTAVMLPDSNTNEPASHGYVAFGIKPKANLPKSTQLTNTANIYFDYNSPVATNTTLNTIDYTLSVSDLENSKVSVSLMPNPFKDATTIKIDGEASTYQLKMFDMMGQLVRTDISIGNVFTIQRETLAAGVYMYSITKQNKLVGQGKMIAE